MQLRKVFKGFGTMDALATFAIGFVVLAIVIAVGANVLTNLQSTQTINSVAYNVSGSGLSALNQFGTWFPVIVIAGIGAFVIGIIFTFFMGRGKGGY